MKFYLGGPINGCDDAEANDWRTEVKQILEGLGHEWIDPMNRDYRGREMEPGIAREIVENDREDIKQADILLMNCPKPSVGTSMEIAFAYYGDPKGGLIVAVVPSDREPSPWLVYHCDGLVHTYGDAVDKAVELVG